MNIKLILFIETILVITHCLLLLLPVLQSALQDARRLAEVVQAWEESGTHSTLLGKAWRRLAADGWPTAPRDPLVECGIPVVDGDGEWRQLLRLMYNTKERLACMETQILLAWEEHQTHTAAFLMTVALLILFIVFLLEWVWALFTHFRAHSKPSKDTTTDVLQQTEEQTHSTDTDSKDEHRSKLKHVKRASSWPRSHSRKANNSARQYSSMADLSSCLLDITPNIHIQETRKITEEHHEVKPIVRRSLYVPPRFRERLVGPEERHLKYLQTYHSVTIFMDDAKRRMHIKGAKNDAVECHRDVRTLLEKWQKSEPPPAE